jgi:hypothetical protein
MEKLDAGLFGDHFAGTAELGREVLELRQTVLHAQNRFAVIDVHAGRECQAGDRGGKNVHQPQRRMVGHQMAAAFGAISALAERGLGKGRDMLGAFGNFHGFGLPETEGIDRAAGPGPAGPAMAISHGFRIAADFDLNGAAKTCS